MDLVKEAIFLGFSGAAVMDTKELVFVPEYRTFYYSIRLCHTEHESRSSGERNSRRDETTCTTV